MLRLVLKVDFNVNCHVEEKQEKSHVWEAVHLCAYVGLSKQRLSALHPFCVFQQVLQAVCAAHVLLRPDGRALVHVGGVSVGGVLHPRAVEVHLGAERHLAGQQRGPHVGKQALWQDHQPQGERVCHIQRYRYETH